MKFYKDPSLYAYVLLTTCCLTVSYEVAEFRAELRAFKGTVVDIDLVRSQAVEEMSYMFQQGCLKGVDYPDQYKQPTIGFNMHSPLMYCSDELKQQQDYIYDQVSKVGHE